MDENRTSGDRRKKDSGKSTKAEEWKIDETLSFIYHYSAFWRSMLDKRKKHSGRMNDANKLDID